MARTDPQINIRIPQELKSALEDSAQRSGRSLNAEIVARLEGTFSTVIENQLIESRRDELSKLRASHLQAKHDLDQYRNRLNHGDHAPYGPEWLKEVILQSEYRVNRLERLIARTQRELQKLGDEVDPPDSYSIEVARFEKRLALTQERLESLKQQAELVEDMDERERSKREIAGIEATLMHWRNELAMAKRQTEKKPSKVLAELQRLRDEIETDS